MIDSSPIIKSVKPVANSGNNLFPIFLKLENMRLLIVGGGYVAFEKLGAVLTNAPATQITLVSIAFNDEIREAANSHDNILLIEKEYDSSDLLQADIVIAAVNDVATSKRISDDAHSVGKLVNVADKPDLCDFYLSSVVKKGNLKVAISTNGKSPTIAKRLKEVLNETLPAQLDEVLTNMEQIRISLKGDFSAKVIKLNHITRSLTAKHSVERKSRNQKILQVSFYILFAITCMIAGHLLFSYFPL